VTASPRQRIVESALALIAERGLGGVTMTALADAAGVARQTLYNHFPDLDAIVVAVLDQHGSAAVDQLRSLLEAIPDPAGKLEQIVLYRIAGASHGREVGLLSAALSREAQRLTAEHSDAEMDVIAAVIEAGVENGTFRSDLDAASMTLVVQRMLDASGDLVGAGGSPAAASIILGEMIRSSLASGR